MEALMLKLKEVTMIRKIDENQRLKQILIAGIIISGILVLMPGNGLEGGVGNSDFFVLLKLWICYIVASVITYFALREKR